MSEISDFLGNPFRRRATEPPQGAERRARPPIRMEIKSRVPEKWLILDRESKMAWVWDVDTGGWVRAEWPLPDLSHGPSLEETEPALIDVLRTLFDEYGPEGVRRTVAQMINAMKAEARNDH